MLAGGVRVTAGGLRVQGGGVDVGAGGLRGDGGLEVRSGALTLRGGLALEDGGVEAASRAAGGAPLRASATPAQFGGSVLTLEAPALAVQEMRVRAALTVRHFREEAAGLSDFFARVRAKVDAGAAMGANGVPSRAKLTEMHQHYQSVATLLHHGFDDPLAPAAAAYAAVFQECVEATLCTGPCSSHAARAQQYAPT